MRVLSLIVFIAVARVAAAQEPSALICGLPVPSPAKAPPAEQIPVVVALMLCFDKQGGSSAIEAETFLYYIQSKPSEPSRDRWVKYDEATQNLLLADFRRLWSTNFLDDLSIEAVDYTFSTGATGKIVVFHLEERPRIKLVDYESTEKVSRTDIGDRLKKKSIELRLDSFVDQSAIKRAATAIRDLYGERGFQYAEVFPVLQPIGGNAKLASVTFKIKPGPRIGIRDVEFLGNAAFSDQALTGVIKSNKAHGLLSLVTHRGHFDESKFADDAQRIVDHYRDHGFVEAGVGPPTLRVLDDSADGQTRWVQLRVEVDEGRRYTLGQFAIEGNSVLREEALRAVFPIKTGDTYSQEKLRKGLERARDLYGAGGYYEFTAYPDLTPREEKGAAVVDVALKITEGKQYFVHRLAFTGNSLTRDEVIRREMGLVEGGVFNTEALKYSLRRINQLGYFKPLDEQAIAVDRVPNLDNQVDVRLKVEEQNRNQLTFGAGTSQYEGLFVNFSYTTANFLGRSESVTASVQTGTRLRNYQLSFSEPFFLGQAMTAGGSVYSRKVDYAIASTTVDYSEVRSGFNLTTGRPLRRFTRLYATYGYEIVDTVMTADLRKALSSGTAANALLAVDGRYVESSITPTFVFDTVDNPFMPRSGKRLTLSYQYAGGVLGGDTRFIKPEVTVIYYHPVSRRTAVGVRATAGRIWNYGSGDLPYYQRYFLGGENQIRGVDIRTVGPLNDKNVVTGGTKFVVFNAEYYLDLLPQVRLLAFHDAGQAFDDTQPFTLRQLRTSSGVELRVVMPVLNVPFRLIYAWNIYRDAFQPPRGFRFAVGTTF
jgi:outer membrane protein insertion porin family